MKGKSWGPKEIHCKKFFLFNRNYNRRTTIMIQGNKYQKHILEKFYQHKISKKFPLLLKCDGYR